MRNDRGDEGRGARSRNDRHDHLRWKRRHGGRCSADKPCPSGYACHNTRCDCIQACAGIECGPDPHCHEECNTCPGSEVCRNGTCCEPNCDQKVCGDSNGCGGHCIAGSSTCWSQLCNPITGWDPVPDWCARDCSGKSCRSQPIGWLWQRMPRGLANEASVVVEPTPTAQSVTPAATETARCLAVPPERARAGLRSVRTSTTRDDVKTRRVNARRRLRNAAAGLVDRIASETRAETAEPTISADRPVSARSSPRHLTPVACWRRELRHQSVRCRRASTSTSWAMPTTRSRSKLHPGFAVCDHSCRSTTRLQPATACSGRLVPRRAFRSHPLPAQYSAGRLRGLGQVR